MTREITYGEAVRIVRHARGLTQAQLAARGPLSRETLSALERSGDDALSFRGFSQLVDALGAADVLTEAEQLIAAADVAREMRRPSHCAACRRRLPQRRGPGRPRRFCARCAR